MPFYVNGKMFYLIGTSGKSYLTIDERSLDNDEQNSVVLDGSLVNEN